MHHRSLSLTMQATALLKAYQQKLTKTGITHVAQTLATIVTDAQRELVGNTDPDDPASNAILDLLTMSLELSGIPPFGMPEDFASWMQKVTRRIVFLYRVAEDIDDFVPTQD